MKSTDKFFSEALILATTNPQYDKISFIYLPQFLHENDKFRTCCVQNKKNIFTYTKSLALFMNLRTGKSMNNILSYCGLLVAKISASKKYSPV